ncbi:MAG: glycosyltransferase [Muribaculum sp.]|nr:glycosyltransferase [Muribaculum sp.]
MPLISIIMPVYNSHKFLLETLKSIVDQSYKDFELVIIDDNSTDDSVSIIENYFEHHTDVEVKLIKSEINRGASAARNHGLKLAKGKYIFFLDSDDMLESDCLQKLVEPMIKYDLDLCMGLHHILSNQLSEYSTKLTINTIYNDKEITQYCLNNDIYCVPWNKLIKKEILVSYQILFEEGIMMEDTLWILQLSLKLKSFYICGAFTYIYRVHSESISLSTDSKRQAECLSVLLPKFHNSLMVNGLIDNDQAIIYLTNKLIRFLNECNSEALSFSKYKFIKNFSLGGVSMLFKSSVLNFKGYLVYTHLDWRNNTLAYLYYRLIRIFLND